MKIIVGLGNPGRQYAGTRHNVGWRLLDALAVRLGLAGEPSDFDRLSRQRFQALTLDASVDLPAGGSQKVLLLKPQTYMNLSGQAVAAAANFYQVPPEHLLVVLDDMALPVGRLRLRAGGSHGGHNGLRDIERALGTSQYPRLRLGIGAAPPGVAWQDYVLAALTRQQQHELEPAVERGVAAAWTWLQDGIAAAMNRFNVKETDET
jgi:PTH1 family peptidyl-tRNA hydrolase